jgi:recombination protein RecT
MGAGRLKELPMTTNIHDLTKRASMPVRQAGGSTVADFFQANKSSMAAVLPKHVSPDRMLKIALQAVRTTPALQECTSKSLLGAVIQCATMGLEPNTVLGHAYLVPFNRRWAKSGSRTCRSSSATRA